MRVPDPNGDVWESLVIDEVLFLFYAHPAVEISGEYTIVMAIEVLWRVWRGGMEIIIQGSV